MRTPKPIQILPFLAGLALVGCDGAGPTDPFQDLPETLTVEEELTLDVLADPTSTEVALALATTQAGAAHRRGKGWSSEETVTAQAENHFRNAEQAFAQGDLVRAMEQHREGRRLVAQAMEGSGGPRALQAQVERLESLPVTVAADPDGFQNPQGLALQLGLLAQNARNAHQQGNRIQAAQMGVLGEQAVRRHQRDQEGLLAGYPEVKVALGAEAIELATRILGDQGADDEQGDLLAVAEEFQAKAMEALEAGYLRRAVHYAHLAQWWALKAIVLPGGITDEEARYVLDLAQTLFDEAVLVVGADPDELQAELLRRASLMLEAGKGALTNGTCRGIGALWQTAVISSYLLS